MIHLWQITSILITLLTVFYLSTKISRSKKFQFILLRDNRFGAIDGLRGYLALGVFIHHFIITWYWKTQGIWQQHEDSYIQNLGKVGVAVFFMITGLLFTQKLLKDTGNIRWLRLYVSRIFRIYPLYIFALLFITVLAFYETNFIINTDTLQLLKNYVRWMLFQGTKINGFEHTELIIAEVYWTLRYEWLFYLILPMLAFILKLNRSISLSLIAICFFFFIEPVIFAKINSKYFILFAVGGCTAYLSQKLNENHTFFRHYLWSYISLTSLILSLTSAEFLSVVQLVYITIFFIPIALGNDLFGVLSLTGSKVLGEISYSIYLLHGIALYILFTILPFADLSFFTYEEYIISMPFVACIVVIISTLTFLNVELPSMKYGKKLIK
ncbi:acyltransferase [Colwellia sp. MB02u-9]|uniref:acyltransferase family protein n=1 Tax=Colwellia sp. MB02u-9 TaxID=2759823 RepID=UPI0015F7237E|nr:acyltransferase [Colwellia sp. MB02u-9]MBA6295145.1 acyltransferase [Colwellia sp. MB02u-9]